MRVRLASFAAVGSMITSLLASDAMPVAQQNALVHQYCAVCHTDAVRNGGLTLQHFDAAEAAPSLAAMMVSKMNGGAMGAAGIKIPAKSVIDGLFNALTARANGANQWAVSSSSKVPTLTASVARELPSARSGGASALYRLVLTCNAETNEGEMQLAWSPSPKTGSVTAVVDGKRTHTYTVEGKEKMGNGNPITTGPAAIYLFESTNGKVRLPEKSLRISDLFPNETVEFSFDDLPSAARQGLAACYE